MGLDRMRLKTHRFAAVRSWSDGLDEVFKSSVIKRLKSSPLDLDPTRQMLPSRFNPGRYNALWRARVFDDLWWSWRPRDRDMSCCHVSLNPTVIITLIKHVGWSLICGPALMRSTREIDARRRSDAPPRATSPEIGKTCGLVPHGNNFWKLSGL